MFGLGSAYTSIKSEGRTLHSVVEEARQFERRYIMYGTISNPYASSGGMKRVGCRLSTVECDRL